MTLDDEDEYLTTAEVGGRINVPDATLRAWRHRGYGPPGFLLGRTWRYRWSAVRAWLDEQERAAQTTGAGAA